ncbi:hypothetical protein GCM10029964_074070 [Kibdelosporangium lantanae]
MATPNLKEDYTKDYYSGPGAATAGAGIVGDIGATVQGIEDGNWVGVGFGGVGAAMSALSLVADPLAGFLSAGIGWLIEHVSFLREPLDKLCGDPGAVQAESNTWKNIKTELENIKAEYQQAVGKEVSSWQDPVGDAYRTHSDGLKQEIDGYAQAAGGVSTAISIGGIAVGVERGLIRELITTFVAKMVERAIIALAASFFTFGGAAAAFIADAVAEGSILAGKIASKVANLIQKLTDLATKVKNLGGLMGKLGGVAQKWLGKQGQTLEKAATKHGQLAGGLKSMSHTARNGGVPTVPSSVSGKLDELSPGSVLDKFKDKKFNPKDDDGNWKPTGPGIVKDTRNQVVAERNREKKYKEKHPEYD